MKIHIMLVWALLLVQMTQLGQCDDQDSYDDVLDLGERQYDCQYMWMMMNSNGGAQFSGTASCLLLMPVFLGSALFST